APGMAGDGGAGFGPSDSIVKSPGVRDAEAATKAPEPTRPPAAAEAMAGAAKRPRPDKTSAPPPGVLTAGSFDDNLAPQFLRTFAGKFGQGHGVGDLPGRLLGHRLLLLVKNGAGQPVGNARIRITSTAGGPSVELSTRSDGRAVFLTSWDQL